MYPIQQIMGNLRQEIALSLSTSQNMAQVGNKMHQLLVCSEFQFVGARDFSYVYASEAVNFIEVNVAVKCVLLIAGKLHCNFKFVPSEIIILIVKLMQKGIPGDIQANVERIENHRRNFTYYNYIGLLNLT